jgi:hypothetical protein
VFLEVYAIKMCGVLHNKPKAAVHPGQYADGPLRRRRCVGEWELNSMYFHPQILIEVTGHFHAQAAPSMGIRHMVSIRW